MRITFTLKAFDLAGGERVIAIYAEEMQRRGHVVNVVGPDFASPTLRQRIKGLLRGKIVRRPRLLSHFDGRPLHVHKLETLRPIEAEDVPDADVIVATWWETAHWIDALPASKGRKVHFIQHYEVFKEDMKPGVDAAWRLPMPKITISRWLVALAKERFGREDVALVFNSVDMDQFHAPPRRRNPTPVIGMLYSNVGWKGASVGFDAFERLRARLPDAQLITFGKSPESRENPLPAGTIHIQLPPQDTIRDIYARCDLWLCSSNGEGFHLPPLEAMACRCPVVSTRVGGPDDTITDGVNGYVVPIGDAAALAARMEDVLTQPEEDWQRMSDAALATATRYTWHDAADLFEAALIRVAEGAPINGEAAATAA